MRGCSDFVTKLLPQTLRAKLVTLVISCVMIIVLFGGGARIYVEKHSILESLQRTGTEQVELIATAATPLMLSRDYPRLQILAGKIAHVHDVESVRFSCCDGKVVAAGNDAADSDSTVLNFTSPVISAGEKIGSIDLRISTRKRQAGLDTIYRRTALGLLFFGTLTGLVVYLLVSRIIVRPILGINQHMKSILLSQDGAPPNYLAVSSADEIGEMATIFNHLSMKIYETQQRLEEKITLVEQLAMTDSLTGLHNRRYFDDSFAPAFALARRYGESLCLMLLDLDKFKQINDTFGHDTGDVVLRKLAALIQLRTRETDIRVRLGGDEFALLLYRTDKQAAVKLAEDILAGLVTCRFMVGDALIEPQVSIGVADNHGQSNVQAMYSAADMALYEAKRLGRNQVAPYPFA